MRKKGIALNQATTKFLANFLNGRSPPPRLYMSMKFIV